MEIRKYEEKDKENVRYTCLHSEGEAPEKEMCEFVLHIFCDYYIENEPENCFVLSDDGKAVGYVICAENFDKFNTVYESRYIPQIMNMSDGLKTWANEAYEFQNKFKAEYPAHLHIDILPQYQRGGWGSKLIETLLAHLKEKNISGVMLTAGTANKVADKFYRKFGFDELCVSGTDIAFGIKLRD